MTQTVVLALCHLGVGVGPGVSPLNVTSIWFLGKEAIISLPASINP